MPGESNLQRLITFCKVHPKCWNQKRAKSGSEVIKLNKINQTPKSKEKQAN